MGAASSALSSSGIETSSSRAGEHHLGITAIAGGTHKGLVPAKLELALAALGAGVARTAQAADTDALAQPPERGHPFTQSDDAPDDLMAGHPRWPQRWIGAVDVGGVGAADTASLHCDQHLPGPRRGRRALDQFERAGGRICMTRYVGFIVSPSRPARDAGRRARPRPRHRRDSQASNSAVYCRPTDAIAARIADPWLPGCHRRPAPEPIRMGRG